MTPELRALLVWVRGSVQVPDDHREALIKALQDTDLSLPTAHPQTAEAFRLPGLPDILSPDEISRAVADKVVELVVPPLLDALINFLRHQRLKLVEDDGT